MTGLVGVLNLDGRPVPTGVVEAMAGRLPHRSPRGIRLQSAGPFAVATLLDAWSPSEQSLSAPSGLVAAAAGEVYNAPEIAERAGTARGRPDPWSLTSLLLGAYRAQGLAGLAACNGAFTVVFWDAMAERLVLVRDPVGFASMFYRLDGQRLIFASEAKAVLAHPDCPKEPDEVEIANYLGASRYLLQSGRSFYKGVSRLQGGMALVVEHGRAKLERYWSIDPRRAASIETDEARIAATRDLMLDAVRVRAAGAGRLGAALSGGFDSSSVVCAIDHLDTSGGKAVGPIDTFSFDFADPNADELDLIKLVSERTRSRHHHINALDPSLLDELEAATEANDGPILESAVLLLWNKKKRARSVGVEALLSGLGGDELFMGRLNFLADLLCRGRLPTLLREFRGAYPYDYSTGKRVSLKKLVIAYLVAPLEPWPLKDLRKRRWSGGFPPGWIRADFARSSGLAAALPRAHRDQPRFGAIYDQDCFDVFHYELRPTLDLHEAVSAPFGVRTRFPLLDIRLIERMFATPREWKIRQGQVRIMQKLAMRDILPPEIVADHLKKDFHPTLEGFLREQYGRTLPPLFASRDRRSEQFVDWPAVERYFEAFMAGRGKSYPLWCAFNLETWLRREF